MSHIENLTMNFNINFNLATPAIIVGKSSEQQALEYRESVLVEETQKARAIDRMIYRQRLADWARSRFGDDVANTILGGCYK